MTSADCEAVHSTDKLASIGADVLTAAACMAPTASRPADEMLRGLVGEVVSMLAFGGTAQGTFVFVTSPGVAKRICANMLMLSEEEIGNDEIGDGIGEMLNMMGGNYKNEWIKQAGRQLDLTVPSTMFGDVGLTSMRNAREVHAVEFQLDCGKVLFGIITYG